MDEGTDTEHMKMGEDPFTESSREAARLAQAEAEAYTDRGLLEAIYILLRRDEILKLQDLHDTYQRGRADGAAEAPALVAVESLATVLTRWRSLRGLAEETVAAAFDEFAHDRVRLALEIERKR